MLSPRRFALPFRPRRELRYFNSLYPRRVEARTPLHNFISPLLIILCLYLLTDVIIYIPNASLAAIVIVNLFSLFAQFAELKPLWRTSWADFLSFLVCLVLTITLGTEAGLIGGVVSSLLCLVICILVARKRTDRGFRR